MKKKIFLTLTVIIVILLFLPVKVSYEDGPVETIKIYELLHFFLWNRFDIVLLIVVLVVITFIIIKKIIKRLK